MNPVIKPSSNASQQNNEELTPFDQVAGHDTGPATRFLASNGTVYKPLQSEARGSREVTFYESLKDVAPEFIPFAPAFYGCKEVEFQNEQHVEKHKFLVMEDLTFPFNSNTLSVADIKMGTRTYDDQASEKKRNYEIFKASKTTTITLGLRFCGLKVYQEGIGIKKFNKDWGKGISDKNIHDGLSAFLHNGKKLRMELIQPFVQKLRRLLEWFEKNSKLRFYGTSLLLLYDVSQKIDPVLKVIDFAHVDPILDGGKDDGYIFGLKNLIKVFEEVENSFQIPFLATPVAGRYVP